MAPRRQPTVRQRRFGAELRRLREAAQLTPSTVAGLLETDRTVISNVEAGRFGISETRLRRLVDLYGCTDHALIDGLTAMMRGRENAWWERYRGKVPDGFLDVSELEDSARAIRTLQTAQLPGLFQTEAHARALFNLTDPPLSRLEVDLRVDHRLSRQAVIAEGTMPYVGLVHEAALRMRVGGRQEARRQIDSVLEASHRGNVALLVIPFSVGEFPMMGISLMYAEGQTRQLDTAHMDSPAGAIFMDDPGLLARYRRRLDTVEKLALTPSKSRDLIRAIGREM
ncbi:helix-turn-helix domain-containing protein [Streptomyces xiamenensis]|uniref:helix-turn-helix domain-containing protein n=1 Tax=Streptomyces xiamenensis TaxID=408015 RepID=UPI003D71E8FF